jgi:DNA-binding SARP family transcriptional activator/tetratricopeptide (TPR) repeat protein
VEPPLRTPARTAASALRPGGRTPQFRILGPLDATVGDGRHLDLGGPKQRQLLAMLLIHLNQVVPAGRLVDALWGPAPSASVDVTLRSHVSHLRQRLAAAGASGSVVTRPPGYGLFLDPEQVDAYRFERLVGLGQEALGLADPERAADLLREALKQWRGAVLEDLGHPVFAESAARLDELRLVAVEGRIDAELALGRHNDVTPELERLAATHPFRERLLGQLMLALYRSGRQVDALGVFSAARQRLADELGLDPGPALTALETAILRHDPVLLPPAATPVAATDATPRATVRPPPDALFSAVRRVPMVGRSGELDRLCALWRDVREGSRGVVLVSGEAGIGKTRLVAEFAHRAAETDTAFLVARCEHVSVFPYHPVAAALRASVEAANALAVAPDAIRVRLAPLLEPGAADLPTDDAAGERLALFAAVEWLFRQIAGRTPVVLVVEESERIDRASSLLIRHLAAQLPRRALVVVCFRDPPGSRHPPLLELLGDLDGRGLADRLVLAPLPEGHLGALVTGLTGADAPAGLVQELWRQTGGNPFYATEVVRDIQARDGLAGTGRWPVPSGVRDVLRHRLHALAEPTRQVVRCAAVFGREVEFGLLAQLVDQSEDQLIDSLEGAVGAGFLVEAGHSWKASYAFPHDLTRDAVYADIPVPRRQRLHLRAARALQPHTPGRGADVVAAALHLREAGPAADPLQTAELSLRAADEAQRLYAWDEAIVHAEAAVEILDHAGAPAAQQADAAVRAALLRTKSSIGYRRAVEHLEAALERYRAIGDDAALGSVHSRIGGVLCTHHSVMDIPRAIEHFAAAQRLLAEPRAVFHLHRGMMQAAMYGLRAEVLGTSAQRADELSAELDRRDLTVFAGWGGAWYRFNRGELASASAIHEAMWATAHERGDPYLGWVSVNAAALCATGYLLDPARARMWCRRGLAQARFDTFAHPHDTVVDQLVLAMAAMGDMEAARRAAEPLPADAVSRRLLTFLDADWERAERSWAGALAADEAAGDLHDAALNARWLADARLHLGRDAGAVAALHRALTLGTDGPQVPTELAARTELARVLAAAGRVDDAVGHLARCDEILGHGEDWGGQVGAVELARGAVLAARGQRGRSDGAHEKALEIFTAYHLPWRRADALHAWARLLLAAGHADDAVAKHRAAWDAYDEIGAVQRWRRPLTEP